METLFLSAMKGNSSRVSSICWLYKDTATEYYYLVITINVMEIHL